LYLCSLKTDKRDMTTRNALRLLTAVAMLLPASLVHGQGLLDKGVAAEQKGLTELAEGYYRQAADTSAGARLRLGLLLEEQERYGEAARWLAGADSSALALCHLALCQTELRQWAAARQSAEKSIELADTSAHALRSSAMASLALVHCQSESYTNALHWARQAMQEDPASARALNVMGVVLYSRGNEQEALQRFREALKVDPANVDAHFNLGTIYCRRNNYDMAITTLRAGLKQHRRSVKLFYCFGWAYLLKGDREHAIECLENVLQLDSTHVNAYNRLGDIYFDRAEYNRAIEQYRRAIHFGPGLSEAYRLLGRTYAAQNDFGRAIRQYQKAVEIDPRDADTYCRIAELYNRQNQPKREQANYKRAARLGHREAQQWCTKHGVTYQ
jgi:tetratricopeptide (TPR) repeat protein